MAAQDTCGCYDSCSICGFGTPVRNPSALVSSDGRVITCAEAQATGQAGNFSPETCSAIQRAFESDCCTAPTEAPTSRVEPVCDLCSDGGSPRNLGGLVAIGVDVRGVVEVTCAEALELGLSGAFTPNTCRAIQSNANIGCGCGPEEDLPSLCSICPNGQVVNPEAIIMSGELMATCERVQQLGLAGEISDDACGAVQSEASSVCCKQYSGKGIFFVSALSPFDVYTQ